MSIAADAIRNLITPLLPGWRDQDVKKPAYAGFVITFDLLDDQDAP